MKNKISNIDQLTDLEIIKIYQADGDKKFVGALFKRYMPLVYGICLKYLKERETAKDLTMQVFEKLISNLKTQDIQNFKSWLYVLSKNECLMFLRKETRQKGLLSNNADEFMELSLPQHLNEEPVTADVDKLETCIGCLNQEQQHCIKLFYLEKKCYQEICDITGYEMKKVKSYLQNGRRNLKSCIEKLREKSEQTY